MTAAQLFDAARRADPAIEDGIGKGQFKPLTDWLGVHVHGKGSLTSARKLLIEATGRPLDPKVFIRLLKARYLP